MNIYANPFTPVFGNEPPILAGRSQLINNAINGLQNMPGDPNRITIFTGPRGSGKTVLLNTIASRAEEIGFISVHTAASSQMLTQLIEQVERRANHILDEKAKSKLTGVQIYGMGIQREVSDERKLTWRAEMDNYLDMLAKHEVGLIFTIDEVSAAFPEMVEFISTFQFFVREKRNVALLMAGLPVNVIQMFQNPSISFLRRAFRRTLDPISLPEVRATIKKTIEISGREIEKEALDIAAEYTKGLPFLIQLIGYHAFNQSIRKKIIKDDVIAGISDAEKDMESMILDATINDISDTDIKFLLAMLSDEDESRVSDIASRMEVSLSYAGHYRKRLINQGIISESGRGKVIFSMPMFKELLAKRYFKGNLQ